jgi:hypothetical protein
MYLVKGKADSPNEGCSGNDTDNFCVALYCVQQASETARSKNTQFKQIDKIIFHKVQNFFFFRLF